jgi:hypothetical protein
MRAPFPCPHLRRLGLAQAQPGGECRPAMTRIAAVSKLNIATLSVIVCALAPGWQE